MLIFYYLNDGQFDYRTKFDDLNTGQVRYSDFTCIFVHVNFMSKKNEQGNNSLSLSKSVSQLHFKVVSID